MPISVDYVARETASNLWRNRLMTIAAMLTVAVSLSLVGAALLFKQGVSVATIKWRGGVNLAVFMQPSVANSQQTAVGHELSGDPSIRTCHYMNHQQSYQEMKRLFPNQPDMVSAVTPQDLPPSYRCQLRDANEASAVAAEYNHQPGVLTTQYPGQQVKTMLRVTNVLQVAFLVVAIILLLSATVLILNTIRLAIFSRRREVAVMKLVGATNWFIRIPFMLEGLVQGLIGAVVAFGVVVGLHALLDDLGSGNQGILSGIHVSLHDTVITGVLVLVVGAAVGAVGSALAVRRFLEV